MSNVIIEGHRHLTKKRQQAGESYDVFGGEVIDESGEFTYPYGVGVMANGLNAYTTVPGVLFTDTLRVDSVGNVVAHGTYGDDVVSLQTSDVSTRTRELCCAKSASSAACTGIAHDVRLNIAQKSGYHYAIPQHSGSGTDTFTAQLGSDNVSFPAIQYGYKIYFFVPCAWGYPISGGTRFPVCTMQSAGLQFIWRNNWNTTLRDVIPMDIAANFRASCEPFGFNCEYRLPLSYVNSDLEATVAGLVVPTSPTVSIKFA